MIAERLLESLPVQLLVWSALACAIRMHRAQLQMAAVLVPRQVRQAVR